MATENPFAAYHALGMAEGVAAERVRLLGMLRDPDEEWMQHLRFVSAIDRDQLLLLADVLSARLTDPKEDA